MRIKKLFIMVVTAFSGLMGHSGTICSTEQTLIVITHPFEPYVYPRGSDRRGIDYEVTEAVFKNLNIPVQIKYYPWKRCLMMMMNKEADAIIDLLMTEERKRYLIFPEEPISVNPLVVFYHKGNRPHIERLQDLRRYIVGTELGWEYPKELDAVLVNKERVRSLEQNFHKLLSFA